MRVTRIAGVVGSLAITGLALASAAWACSASTEIKVTSGPGPVTVTGERFIDRMPVEIRWNSASGKLLATTSGPSFSLPISTPATAASGVYSIVAIQRDPTDGAVVTKAAAPFEIATAAPFEIATAAAEATPRPSAGTVSGDLWSALDRGATAPRLDNAPVGARHVSPIGMGLLLGGAAGLVGAASMSMILVPRRRAKATRHNAG
ncbi:MAG TPA: hypothetical protein VM142_13720 [Acidimicrobiales bacterium]|nr:hypothetical protein [Acidimicrobiales bacterium]